ASRYSRGHSEWSGSPVTEWPFRTHPSADNLRQLPLYILQTPMELPHPDTGRLCTPSKWKGPTLERNKQGERSRKSYKGYTRSGGTREGIHSCRTAHRFLGTIFRSVPERPPNS